jgi:hypothetical protein
VQKIRCSYVSGRIIKRHTNQYQDQYRPLNSVGPAVHCWKDGWMSIAMQNCRCRVVGGSWTAFTPAWRLCIAILSSVLWWLQVLFRDRVSWIKLCDFSVKITRNLCICQCQLGRHSVRLSLSVVEQCFSLTANQAQPAYKPKNSLPNRANGIELVTCYFALIIHK